MSDCRRLNFVIFAALYILDEQSECGNMRNANCWAKNHWMWFIEYNIRWSSVISNIKSPHCLIAHFPNQFVFTRYKYSLHFGVRVSVTLPYNCTNNQNEIKIKYHIKRADRTLSPFNYRLLLLLHIIICLTMCCVRCLCWPAACESLIKTQSHIHKHLRTHVSGATCVRPNRMSVFRSPISLSLFLSLPRSFIIQRFYV